MARNYTASPSKRKVHPPVALMLLILWLASGTSARADEEPAAASVAQLRALGTSLVSREPFLSALGLMAAAAAAAPYDDGFGAWAAEHEPLGPDARDWGYWMAHRYTVAGSIVALGAAGWAFDESSLSRSGLLLLEAQLLSAGVTQALKYATRRERPDASNDHSFPSGHATAAWTTAALLQGRHGWKLGLPAHVVAGFVGGSRIQARKHHLSDVLFGFAVGQWATRAVLRSSLGEASDSPLQLLPAAPPRFDGIGLLRLRF